MQFIDITKNIGLSSIILDQDQILPIVRIRQKLCLIVMQPLEFHLPHGRLRWPIPLLHIPLIIDSNLTVVLHIRVPSILANWEIIRYLLHSILVLTNLQTFPLQRLNQFKRPVQHLFLLLVLIDQIAVVHHRLTLALLGAHGFLGLGLSQLYLAFDLSQHLLLHLLDADHQIVQLLNLSILDQRLLTVDGGMGAQG